MKVLHVSEFIEIINGILRETWSGEEIAVEGEVSGFRVSQGQWVSFDLKDDKALVNVFTTTWQLKLPVEDGMRVRIFGFPRVYPKYGKFSLSAERIELAGEGTLRKALALLRARLEKEGLFDPTRKRELPRFPQRIALIASRESAAYGDFIRVLGERWGGLEIDLYHVLVQGDRAPQDIVNAIQSAQGEEYDVLVMTRGGGSLEELMAFNDEQVVRAIHASRIPTLVAVGHERDVTLAEEAADVRGSTPTDCARRLVPDRRDVAYELATLVETVDSTFLQTLERGHVLVERALGAPGQWLASRKTAFEAVSRRTVVAVDRWLEQLASNWQSLVRVLSSLDPRRVLARGYAIVTDANGRSVASSKTLRVGQDLSIQLKDGSIDATVSGLGKQRVQPRLF